MSAAVSLHALAAVVWVGGMFFAFTALRPAAAQVLEAPLRLKLWSQVLTRFFVWVWVAVPVVLISGFWMTLAFYGGFGSVGLYVHLMAGPGLLMSAIFLHLYFAPYRRLRAAVDAEDWPAAGKQLNQIRVLVATNLALGLAVVVVGAGGRYFAL
jgi:uncharacterized membrane protein